MPYSRVRSFRPSNLMAVSLMCVFCFSASGQSVISTHSGVVHFFTGSVFLGGEELQPKFGKFPEIGNGVELRTEDGRAEVLLTPGYFLRVGANSAIRMASNDLSDTRIELLAGSAIVESPEKTIADTSVTLLHKNWQIRFTQHGVYRVDSEPAQLQVMSGEAQVSAAGKWAPVTVRRGQVLPFAEVLVPDDSTLLQSTNDAMDPFRDWAMLRSEAVAADNATAAEISDDPGALDSYGMQAGGGFTYFPLGGIPALNLSLNNPYGFAPYGFSFWAPFQTAYFATYVPRYPYGTTRFGFPVYPGTTGLRGIYPGGYYPPTRTVLTPRPGVGGGVGLAPRPVYSPGVSMPRPAAPHVVAHPVGHR